MPVEDEDHQTRIIIKKIPVEDSEDENGSRRSERSLVNSQGSLARVNRILPKNQGIVKKSLQQEPSSFESVSYGVSFAVPLSSARPLLSSGEDTLRASHTRRISERSRAVGKSVIYAKLPRQAEKGDILGKFEEQYRSVLLKLHSRVETEFKSDPENLILLFYFCLTCLLMGKIEHCRQIINLAGSVHQLTYRNRGFVVLDYYMVKIRNIETLVSALERRKILQTHVAVPNSHR